VVWWEDREQILDGVVEIGVESVLCEEHTVLKGAFLLHFDEVLHSLEVGDHAGRSRVVLEGEKVSLWVIEIGNKVPWDVNKELIELVSAPFNAVLNLIWEVSKSAHWDGLFWWILGVTVALGYVRDDHLRVSLGTKSSGLKERLLVPNASCVDVESSLDVIDSIDNEVLAFPEIIVENAVDNIKARLYVDARCVWYEKPLLESGTLGTKANSQMIVPHVTQCYGDSQDPPEEAIPMCTLRNFPNQIEHCIEWSRDKFNELFVDVPGDLVSYLDNPKAYLFTLKNNSTSSGMVTNLQRMKNFIKMK
jgi:hypothetical protein